jgi:hypothetical protein
VPLLCDGVVCATATLAATIDNKVNAEASRDVLMLLSSRSVAHEYLSGSREPTISGGI